MGPMLSRRFTATKEDSAAYRNLTKRCVRRLLCGHMLPQTPHHGMHAPQHQHTKLTIVRFVTPEARAKLIRGISFPRSHRQVLPPPATHASPDHGVIPAPNAKFLLVNGKKLFLHVFVYKLPGCWWAGHTRRKILRRKTDRKRGCVRRYAGLGSTQLVQMVHSRSSLPSNFRCFARTTSGLLSSVLEVSCTTCAASVRVGARF